MTAHALPAVLGGSPIRSQPYPAPNYVSGEERRLVAEVLDSGVLSAFIASNGPGFLGGPMVRQLEAEFGAYFGMKHAVSVNSATSGLHAAVAATLAGPGDEVIVPPYTMSATATVVIMCGASPVFADIDEERFCIAPAAVEKLITPRTKAIVAVNLFGNPARLHELRSIADRHGVFLIEDNAQAPGATIGAAFTGTIGHLSIFSLNCHKTIQCGEGGVVLTNDAILADRLHLVRNHGEVVLSMRPEVPAELYGLVGFNYRLTELQAAVALAQFRRLAELTDPRIVVAETLTRRLSGLAGLTPPTVASNEKHVYYLYAYKYDAEKTGLSRNQFNQALLAEGMPSIAGYVRPIYLYPLYSDRVARQRAGYGAGIWRFKGGQEYAPGLCPVTERMHFHELMLTNICRGDLGPADANDFADAIEKVLTHARRVREAMAARGVD